MSVSSRNPPCSMYSHTNPTGNCWQLLRRT